MSKEKKQLDLSKLVSGISFSFYHDQCGHRLEELDRDESQCIIEDALVNLCRDSTQYDIYGICHSNSFTTDENYNLVPEKVHGHVALLCRSRKRIQTILKDISDYISFEPEYDSFLLDQINVLNVQRNDHKTTFMYFLHQTTYAEDIDGKEPYLRSDLITNINDSVLDDWENWYDSSQRGVAYTDKMKSFLPDRDSILQGKFYNYALQGLSYFTEYSKLSNEDKFKINLDKKLQHAYEVGKREYLASRPVIDRCSIYIQGPADFGKTYAVKYALQKMNRNYCYIGDSSGTGETDKCDLGDCLVYDDKYPKNVLTIASDEVCDLYHRNKNNGIFNGDFLIVISNKSFDDFFSYMTSNGHYDSDALKSRFSSYRLECDGTNVDLVKDFACTRGNLPVKEEKEKKFISYMVESMQYYCDNYKKTLDVVKIQNRFDDNKAFGIKDLDEYKDF